MMKKALFPALIFLLVSCGKESSALTVKAEVPENPVGEIQIKDSNTKEIEEVETISLPLNKTILLYNDKGEKLSLEFKEEGDEKFVVAKRGNRPSLKMTLEDGDHHTEVYEKDGSVLMISDHGKKAVYTGTDGVDEVFVPRMYE